MVDNYNIKPKIKELPSHFADRLGAFYSISVDQEHKKKNGQFFTPTEIASFMASYSRFNGNSVEILDPGCGSMILSCALIEHLVRINKNLNRIKLTAYETDEQLIPFANRAASYLKEWLKNRNINIIVNIYNDDFILNNATCLNNDNDLFSHPIETFDIVISNPPYFKLSIDDKRAIAGRIVVNGHPNIYSIFMAVAARLLKNQGEIISITPRSFASGGYFKIFRKYFFNLIELNNVHLFISRKDTFSRDKVLQETVIIYGKRKPRSNTDKKIIITSSDGIRDIKSPVVNSFSAKDIINTNSNQSILYLPTSEFEKNVLDTFKQWLDKLHDFGISISTGPVVAFRAGKNIIDDLENVFDKVAPLFWLHNIKQMMVDWPLIKPFKGQYILISDQTKSLLIPNKNYVFLRRFSSKDDKYRLIAAPYFCNYIESEYIGVENKVNYIYRPNGYLDRNEVVGLCALLNSNLFDTYFRIFNGNVNVSATELREMTFPPLETIKEIGDSIILSNDFSVENSNRIVQEYLQLEFMYEKD